ncbi:MAG: type II toxin-antitoxin system mRNA interferase toxin, RelE/StbE family [Patescibacteria group bacterium]
MAEEKEKIFRENLFDPRLKTHKLSGKLKDFWAFSVDYKYRIIFEISKDKKTIYFHSVSDYDIYK